MTVTPSDDDVAEFRRLLGEMKAENTALRARIEALEGAAAPKHRADRPRADETTEAAPTSRRVMLATGAALVAGLLVTDRPQEAAAANDFVPRVETLPAGTATAVWQAPTPTSSTAQLTVSDTAVFSGNGQDVHDPVLYLGWNVGTGSAPIDWLLGGVFLAMEADYWTDSGFDGAWHHQTEFHIESFPAQNNGWGRRVFSSQHAWHTRETFTSLHADYFAIHEGGPGIGSDTEERQVLGWTPGGHVFINRPRVVLHDPFSGSAGVDLMLNADANTPGSLSFVHLASHDDGDAGIYWDDDVEQSTPRWLLHRSGLTGLELFDVRNVRTHARFDFDAAPASTPTTELTGRTTLRPDVGQATPVLEVRDASDQVVLAINPDGTMVPVPGGLTLLASPVRVFDSRSGFAPNDVTKGRFSNETRVVDLLHGTTIPAGCAGLLVNLAVTETSPGGFATLWSEGTAWPGTASINWSGSGGQTVSNSVATTVDASGLAQCKVDGAAHVVIDVVGVLG